LAKQSATPPFTPGGRFDVASAMQMLALHAIAAYRKWGAGELAFQGGTSLHLAHGSSRFSEDLDFVMMGHENIGGATQRSIDMPALAKALARRCEDAVRNGMTRFYPDANFSVTLGRDERNPHVFTITMTDKSFSSAVRVKVELFVSDFANDYRVELKPVGAVTDGARRMVPTQAFLPVAQLDEILVDKVHAIAKRPYLKARDFYDLHYLASRGVVRPSAETWLGSLARHAALYKDDVGDLVECLRARREVAVHPDARKKLADDLKIWLPPGQAEHASLFVEEALRVLDVVQDEIDAEVEAETDQGPSESQRG
jgi:predicted nucleotidyltransferase component of viral defense system